MKKLLLICASVVATVAAYGQGTIGFLNDANTTFQTNGSTIGQGTGLLRGANQYRIGLYWGPQGTPAGSLTLIAVATNSSLSGGRFQYGSGSVDIPGNTGQPIAYQVRAWSLALGNSYEAAVAAAAGGQFGWGGESPVSQITPTSSSTSPVPPIFGDGTIPGQLTSGVTLIPLVPEPSSIALGLLGLGAIALFRRRK
jgi:hypothetical protein